MNAALSRATRLMSAADGWSLPWQELQRQLALGSPESPDSVRIPGPTAPAPVMVSWLRRGQARKARP